MESAKLEAESNNKKLKETIDNRIKVLEEEKNTRKKHEAVTNIDTDLSDNNNSQNDDAAWENGITLYVYGDTSY